MRSFCVFLRLHLLEDAREPHWLVRRELDTPGGGHGAARSPHAAIVEDLVDIELVVQRDHYERRDIARRDGQHHHAGELALVAQKAWNALHDDALLFPSAGIDF